MNLTQPIEPSTSTPIAIGATTSISTDASTSTSTSASGATTSTDIGVSSSASVGTSASTSSTTASTVEASASTSAYAYSATTMKPVVANAQPRNDLYMPIPIPISGASSKRDVSSDTFEGCIELDMGVSVNAGAQGKLLNLWSGDINWDIYSQNWDIFEVSCFLCISQTLSYNT